jgi:type I restriction enzyme, S subunit
LKPYPSYIDSGVEWVGFVPRAWELKRLKHVSIFQSGFSFKSEDFSRDEAIPVIRIGDIGDKIDFDKCVKVPESFLHRHQDFTIKSNDILIGMTGATIGKSGRYNYSKPSLLNQRVCILRNESSVFNGLLYYFVKSEIFKRYILFYCYGGGQDNIGREDIVSMLFPLPPQDEQERIVHFLDSKTQKIDKLIELTKETIQLLKEQRIALINQCVTKGLNPNVEMKDSGVEWIGEIPKDWDRIPFKYEIEVLTDFTANGSFKSLRDNVTYLESGYSRLVRLTDLRVHLNNEGVFVSKESHEFLKKSELFGDEMLIACVGAYTGIVIKMAKNQGVCTLGPNMYLIRNKVRTSDTDFLTYLLNSDVFQFGLKFGINKTAQEKINKDNVKDLQIARPPLSEQIQIVNFLNLKTQKIDTRIENESQRIKLLKEYRQALISEVVTGKIDVRDEVVA